MKLFVFSDIHGCYDEFSLILDSVLKNEFDPEIRNDHLIFLGDYVDRGEKSAQVIQRCIELQREYIYHTEFLLGNHEDMLMGYLGLGGSMGQFYLQNGGAKTLQSYGVTDPTSIAEALECIPKSHIEFLTNLLHYHKHPDTNYLFVHAGVLPDVPLEEQGDNILLWIRDHFFYSIKHSEIFRGTTIVHGHTPSPKPAFDLPNRIGIDTGCVFGNELTCLIIDTEDDSHYRTISVARGSDMIKHNSYSKANNYK